jgi:hypothetical protein
LVLFLPPSSSPFFLPFSRLVFGSSPSTYGVFRTV